MLRKVIRHEWRLLTADATAWLVVSLFAVLVGYAIYNGAIRVREQRQAAAEFARPEIDRYEESRRQAGQIERQKVAAGQSLAAFETGPRHPLVAGFSRAVGVAMLLPAPLGALAVGQSDLHANYQKVTILSEYDLEYSSATEPMENPLKLLTGHVDLAFVMLYLYPLLILLLSYNLVASEKELGTLGMALAQPLRLRTLVVGKILVRVLIILLGALVLPVIGLALGGADLQADGAVARLLLWLTAVTLYGAFWFTLAVWVNARGYSAAANALILAVCWLALLVVVPAAINLAATTLYPVPSRAAFISALRQEITEAGNLAGQTMKAGELARRFFAANHGVSEDDMISINAMYFLNRKLADDEVERQARPLLAELNRQRQRQQRLVNWTGYLTPAVLAQAVLYEAAGAGDERYQDYSAQVAQLRQARREFFWDRVFRRAPINAADYEKIPQFHYREESSAALWRRSVAPLLALAVLAAAFGALGLRAYQRFPIVG
jgi:ABC-2 type transport system permease protein